MTITGLHHITLICGDAQRTIDFYTELLGLHLVKKTVNFDDPGAYHLYFGNETGSPGSAITFFEWKDAPRGAPGIGGTHHFALRVTDRDALLRWKRRLTDRGHEVDGPLDRHYFTSIYFNDPDGTIIEIATDGPGFLRDESEEELGQNFRPPPREMVVRNRDKEAIQAESWPEPVPTIDDEMELRRGMHHISAIGSDIRRTNAFFEGLLGLQRVKMTANFDDPDSAHWYWGVENGRPGSLITYFERSESETRRARMGRGQTHHFAFSVPSDEEQLAFRERILAAGIPVSAVLDRVYFKSIYTRDPDGHIVEIATAGPGFLIDEAPDRLGHELRLPPWLEANRARIEAGLSPVGTKPRDEGGAE